MWHTTPYATAFLFVAALVLIGYLGYWAYYDVHDYNEEQKSLSQWMADHDGLVIGGVSGVVLMLASVIALRQLTSLRRTRYADLLVRLTEAWNSDPFVRSRHLIYVVAPLSLDEDKQRHRVCKRMKTAERTKDEEYFTLTLPLDFF